MEVEEVANRVNAYQEIGDRDQAPVMFDAIDHGKKDIAGIDQPGPEDGPQRYAGVHPLKNVERLLEHFPRHPYIPITPSEQAFIGEDGEARSCERATRKTGTREQFPEKMVLCHQLELLFILPAGVLTAIIAGDPGWLRSAKIKSSGLVTVWSLVNQAGAATLQADIQSFDVLRLDGLSKLSANCCG